LRHIQNLFPGNLVYSSLPRGYLNDGCDRYKNGLERMVWLI
jgi:hypothetical protein